jgi:hypothetical protein
MTTAEHTQIRRDVLLARARNLERAWEDYRGSPERLFEELRVSDKGQVAAVAIALMSMLADEVEGMP